MIKIQKYKELVIIALLLFISIHSFSKEEKRVLLISSYNSSFPTFFQQIDGIREIFDSTSIHLDIEAMDTKRFMTPDDKENFYSYLSYKLSKLESYAAIITSDDNALKFVLEYQSELFKETPIVFCGVNNTDLAIAQNDNPWVTGIIEAVSMKETIDLMLDLFPDYNAIYSIVDSTSSGLGDLETLRRCIKSRDQINYIEIDLNKLSFKEYEEILQNIPSNAPTLLLSAYHDKTKKVIRFDESMNLLTNNIHAPLFHLWQHGFGEGILGGKIISHHTQGKNAAKIALDVIEGRDLTKIKVEESSPNHYTFDYNELTRFEIDLSSLPEGAFVINKPESFYKKNRLLINSTITIFILLVAFIITLSLNVFRRRDAESKLRNTLQLMDMTQNLTSSGSWFLEIPSRDFYWSDVVFTIHGLEKPKSNRLTTEYFEESLNCFLEEDQEEIKNQLDRCAKEGLSFDKEYKFIDFNGIEKWVHIGGHPRYKQDEIVAIYGFITDISKEHDYNKELRDAKSSAESNEIRYKNLFSNNPVSLWDEDLSSIKDLIEKKKEDVEDIVEFINTNDDFVYKCMTLVKVNDVNQATLDLYGYTQEELMLNIGNTFTESSFNSFRSLLRSLAMGNPKHAMEVVYKNSKEEPIYAMFYFFASPDYKRCIIAIVDITRIKHIENELKAKYDELQASDEELKEANIQLKISKEKAEESDRLKTQFIHNMSHEIRTPMNGIMGFAELLKSENINSSKIGHYTNIIQNSGKQLLRVIDDILEISRLGTKQVKLIETEFNLNVLLLEQFSIFEPKAKENNLSLYLHRGIEDEAAYIISDESKIQKILSNLLENAIKYTNTGFIEFGYTIENAIIQIFVKDSGIGIEKEKQDIIFDRFAQEDKEDRNALGGLGLGLSIAKENAELLGGSISLESEKGKGALFTIRFPHKIGNKSNTSESSFNIGIKQHPVIIVAEDEEVNYLFIETLLEEKFTQKFIIKHARTGKDVLDLCDKLDDVSLILMDIKMPVMDGLTATKILTIEKPEIPIIAITAYTSFEDRQKALDNGCKAFISKPIDVKTFVNQVNTHIE
jgi:signal transduction histidine kinase/ABC-type uncharacterized transport system substrate-binding protein